MSIQTCKKQRCLPFVCPCFNVGSFNGEDRCRSVIGRSVCTALQEHSYGGYVSAKTGIMKGCLSTDCRGLFVRAAFHKHTGHWSTAIRTGMVQGSRPVVHSCI